jgi:hypothetical protein
LKGGWQCLSKRFFAWTFDGCVHAYRNGWQDGKIYDVIVPGFLEWASDAFKHFRLVIYSSRSRDPELRAAMMIWMENQIADWALAKHKVVNFGFEYADEKPPAWLTIDDRAVRFDGSWMDQSLSPENLLAFKPWMESDDSWKEGSK